MTSLANIKIILYQLHVALAALEEITGEEYGVDNRIDTACAKIHEAYIYWNKRYSEELRKQ